jgi:anti-sigma regulatory factor (Ser/Thr protein kinase)
VEIVTGVATRIPIAESSRISEARRTAVSLAGRIGFDETKSGEVAIAVTEAATNLIKHGGGGEILLRVVGEFGSAAGLEFLALDKGSGIANIGESLRDGQSTAGSPGTGLGAIARLSDELHVYSQPGKGTAILVQFWQKQPVAGRGSDRPIDAKPLLDIDGISVAVEGEQLSGDAWSYRATPKGMVVFVADGLGHGPLAESAASEAVRAFEKNFHRPAAVLLDMVHQATRATRGAAVAVACIDLEERMVRFSGIGNIAAALVAGNEIRHMVSMNGIVGHQVRTFREFCYPWQENALLVMLSDGLGTRWDFHSYPGLAQKPCGLIAGVLYRDLVRGRDDATVVVVRQHPERAEED